MSRGLGISLWGWRGGKECWYFGGNWIFLIFFEWGRQPRLDILPAVDPLDHEINCTKHQLCGILRVKVNYEVQS